MLNLSVVRSIWKYASGIAILDTAILLFTGVENFLEEMMTLRWVEAAGLTYFLFILPWYLSVITSLALIFWPGEGEVLLQPRQARAVHFLNLMFLTPALLVVIFYLYSLLLWAFTPSPSIFDWFVIISCSLIAQFVAVRASWKFLRRTLVGIFRPTAHGVDEHKGMRKPR